MNYFKGGKIVSFWIYSVSVYFQNQCIGKQHQPFILADVFILEFISVGLHMSVGFSTNRISPEQHPLWCWPD